MKGADVVEVYSQPRIAQEASLRYYGGTELKAGWSLHLTMRNPKDGQPWDLSKREVQDKVKGKVRRSKPFIVIGSPPCTAFSQLQGWNNHRRDPDVVKSELKAAKAHVNICFELYEGQRRNGRYLIHERPSSATSWGGIG